ncbi:MAG TPA: protein translocase subunit SecF [Candidatus Paceibacterota bacterium]|jgi:preprotein translocase subunit SecF
MLVIRYRAIFFGITAIVLALSIGAIAFFGLHFGLDFTGGSLLEVRYHNERPDKMLIETELGTLNLGSISLRQSGDGEAFILRTRDLGETERQSVVDVLSRGGTTEMTVERFASVGPVIGTELRNKAILAIAIVTLAMMLFIAYVFRHVSKPVSSWKYGVIAIVALLHDIIVPTGVFAVLGYLFGTEIDVLFVVALLAILGYSLNDTIVVFDRVRENLRENQESNRKEEFELTVGKSLNQTYARSINTALTTAMVLLALFFVGSPATRDFALVLIAGIVAGTYSSIFLASPLLVAWEKMARD